MDIIFETLYGLIKASGFMNSTYKNVLYSLPVFLYLAIKKGYELIIDTTCFAC